MKKYIVSLLASVGLSALAASTTITVLPNTYTNFPALGISGYTLVTSVAVAANPTNVSVIFIDAPTNALTYAVPAYTNTISYASNSIVSWTNFYGVVNSWTNIALVDITNNVVSATTNAYPQRAAFSALASTTTTANPTSYQFENGVWVTNNSSGIATVTVTYRQ